MIQVRRAGRQDLAAINELMKAYAKTADMAVAEHHINSRDVALVAREPEGSVVGFLWMGLMACNRIAYLDKFVVHPDYARQGVGKLMALRMYDIGRNLGVKDVFGVIRRDEHHDKSALNALKVAFSAHSDPYTYVCASVDNMNKELRGK